MILKIKYKSRNMETIFVAKYKIDCRGYHKVEIQPNATMYSSRQETRSVLPYTLTFRTTLFFFSQIIKLTL